MKVEESIIINRSPEAVFAFLADREHDSVWMASVVESEWLKPDAGDTDSPTTVGRRGRMVMKNMGRRLKYVDEVTDYEPGRRIAHKTVEGPIKLNTACLTEPAGNGCRATVVAETDSFVGGSLGKVANPIVARIVGRGFRADLTKLKGILEAESGPATNE
ncbi:MAG: SRPBCC family protein [Actinomycetota bacterium]